DQGGRRDPLHPPLLRVRATQAARGDRPRPRRGAGTDQGAAGGGEGVSEAKGTWRRVPLRHLAEFNPTIPSAIRNSGASLPLFPMDAIHEFGPPSDPEIRPADTLLQGYSYIDTSDVAYAKVTPCFENGKGVIGTDLEGPSFATTEVTVLRPRNATLQRFIAYALQSSNFRSQAIASMTGSGGLKRVSEPEMKNFKLPVPNLDTQQSIVDFLDRETTEIDGLVDDLGATLGLNAERTRSLHAQMFGKAVDTGIRPELLGLLRERDLRADDAGNPGPLLSVTVDKGVLPRSEGTSNQSPSLNLGHYKYVEVGDIVVNRMRAFQGALGHSPSHGITSPDYAVLAPNGNANTHYLSEMMRTPQFVSEISRRLRGIGGEESGAVRTPRVSVHDLLRI